MYIFYFDSGTTNTRGYLLRDSELLYSQSVALGSRSVSMAGGDPELLPRGLKQLYDEILAHCGLIDSQVEQIYASGMITSAYGLLEVPHALLPLDSRALRRAITPCFEDRFFHRQILLVPGAKTRGDGVELSNVHEVNNVRGEEIEALGVLDHLPAAWREGQAIVVFPGSHTHALLLENDAIIDIYSNFVGEVFQALTKETILAAETEVERQTPQADPADVGYGLRTLATYGFTRALYVVHATQIFHLADNQNRRDMLNGLLAGALMQSLEKNLHLHWQQARRMAIYGDQRSVAIYRQAAELFLPQLELVSLESDPPRTLCSLEGLLRLLAVTA